MQKTIFRGVSGIALGLALVGCGQPAATTDRATTPTTMGAMAGMDHSAMGTATSATADVPYDARFIDSMLEHHTGAVTMAEQALRESERPEIRELAQNIIATQNGEITRMTAWRDEWYPGLAPTGGTGMSMGDMTLSGDANQSFDQRFVASMISHHQGAIDMARDAQTKAEHPEIKQLAAQIITAQEAEIALMRGF